MITVRPVDLDTARRFVDAVHRHHPPPVGHRVSFGVYDRGGELRAVATVGRPSSRVLAARGWLEVTRVASDGYPNACSALYGAARRWAREVGAPELVTYTLAGEAGGSLRGAGYVVDVRRRARDGRRPRTWPARGETRTPRVSRVTVRWRAW